MREVEHAERAVNDGQAGADQRQQGAKRQAVEYLRNEIWPINHETGSQDLGCTEDLKRLGHIGANAKMAPQEVPRGAKLSYLAQV
jgi:hypothetical protein